MASIVSSVSTKNHRFIANGIDQHAIEWGASTTAEGSATIVLIHGYMDAAGTWDLVAPALVAAKDASDNRSGRRVVAIDMRGFGDTAPAPKGSYYHFADYVADLAAALDVLVPRSIPIALVGHSMGGTIASLFAGAFPERVNRLALLEGVGPEDSDHAVAADRMRGWIEQMKILREKDPARQVVASREDALRRLFLNHPGIAPEILASRLAHLVSELPDGRVRWKYDPLHKTRSPTPFFSASYDSFARRVGCPVLFVSGGPSGYHPKDESARLACFADLRRAEIADAGHMMHWTKPNELSELLRDFLSTFG